MAKSVGKQFEENFKKSIPEDVFCYRPPDAAQGFNIKGNSNLRFSAHSPCDFMVYDGNYMYMFELKTVAGTSISFEKSKEDKGVIHWYQINTLKNYSLYKNMFAGFVIDFRGSDNTYFLNIKEWDKLIFNVNKKSFSEDDMLKYSSPILLDKKKLKVNYKYNIELLLNRLEEMDYGEN